MPESNIAFCNVIFKRFVIFHLLLSVQNKIAQTYFVSMYYKLKNPKSDPFFSSCFKYIEITTLEYKKNIAQVPTLSSIHVLNILK